MKRNVNVSQDIEVEYDEDSPIFQKTLADYREVIDPEATAESMVLSVTQRLTSWGDHQRMVEGVGYVGLIGQPDPDRFCGIRIDNSYGAFNSDFND